MCYKYLSVKSFVLSTTDQLTWFFPVLPQSWFLANYHRPPLDPFHPVKAMEWVNTWIHAWIHEYMNTPYYQIIPIHLSNWKCLKKISPPFLRAPLPHWCPTLASCLAQDTWQSIKAKTKRSGRQWIHGCVIDVFKANIIWMVLHRRPSCHHDILCMRNIPVCHADIIIVLVIGKTGTHKLQSLNSLNPVQVPIIFSLDRNAKRY